MGSEIFRALVYGETGVHRMYFVAIKPLLSSFELIHIGNRAVLLEPRKGCVRFHRSTHENQNIRPC